MTSSSTTRRNLLLATGALALQAQPAAHQAGKPAPLGSSRKIRLGIAGGGFGAGFSFHEHPNCEVTAVTDLRTDRRRKLQEVYKCQTAYESLEQMLSLEKRLDAVAIFTPPPLHYKHTEMSMKRGLHVYCAVPAVFTLEEAAKLKAIKESTGLRYMMGETSWYREGCIYARNVHRAGGFGELFYSELAYYHDRGDLKELVENKKTRFYEPDGSRSWRWGLPPLHYPTHSMGYLVGVTGERIRTVSALGWGNSHPYVADNVYKNPFFNESALMETDRGHMVRCNVFWLIGEDGERAQWYGEKGTLYMANPGLYGDIHRDRLTKPKALAYPKYLNDPMIPMPMRHESGHGGSHVFLSAEFINALVDNREPEIDVYQSLAITVPGIVGHQSALKKGERLKVPSFDKS
ncbi:MAG: Gfo/Idh/MocA family oxidoreductase [Candidatus Solibacter usitatus]|nr:Gfo/Idh/MocA family oxidoreductase [Candidatus Solibacter usitatus]